MWPLFWLGRYIKYFEKKLRVFEMPECPFYHFMGSDCAKHPDLSLFQESSKSALGVWGSLRLYESGVLFAKRRLVSWAARLSQEHHNLVWVHAHDAAVMLGLSHKEHSNLLEMASVFYFFSCTVGRCRYSLIFMKVTMTAQKKEKKSGRNSGQMIGVEVAVTRIKSTEGHLNLLSTTSPRLASTLKLESVP